MRTFLPKVILLKLSIALIGCANPANQFYTPASYGHLSRLLPYSGSTKVFGSANPAADAADLARQNYVVLGTASFGGASVVSKELVEKQAKDVGADIAVCYSKLEGSQLQFKPYVRYNPGQVTTTYTTANAAASGYGYGGYVTGTATGSGTSTSITQGTFTTDMVPAMVNRYGNLVVFWRKGAPPILGLAAEPLPDDLKQKLERNGGLLVVTVMNDSPAFHANVLRGDILAKINDVELNSVEEYFATIARFADQSVELSIIRRGTLKVIPVRLNKNVL